MEQFAWKNFIESINTPQGVIAGIGLLLIGILAIVGYRFIKE